MPLAKKYATECVNTRTAYVRVGLSNWFCPSVVVVCHNFFWKNVRTGDLEATTISKQDYNAEVRGTLACLYLI